ncbi:MAG: hypothetical protein HYV09_03170 [Deltaproteobacteria bacterium]|nr:hypothetical protein [Deltaproteobacteria bacterium]
MKTSLRECVRPSTGAARLSTVAIVVAIGSFAACRKDHPATQGPSPAASASASAPVGRWDPAISARFEKVDPARASEKGCLSCHEGIETISEKMQPFLISFGGGKQGFECTVCHGGKADAPTKPAAHENMYPNPSSMWALNEGKGCAKCHSEKGALTTLMGKPKDHPSGGELMSVESKATDPTGASGKNHVYRMERALMALETGKANKVLSSNGVIEKGTFPYANFDMDDPDGKTPAVGSGRYKEWIAKALEGKVITALDHVSAIPNLQEGAKLWGEEKAGFADMHRKQCGRCHVFGEGRSKRGDHRAGGCAACHVLYNNDGLYEGGDPTIPKDRGPHMMTHRLTVDIPAEQCTHCHTRGKRIGSTFTGLFEHAYVGTGQTGPFDEHGKPQTPLFTKEYNHVRADVHAERGMSCNDCHSSIDVHGDGNIYPVTFYQVEVGCADCHGTPQKYPWELPVGYGTPVELPGGARGTAKVGDKEYLITTRGNARTRWVREGDKAFIVASRDGKPREIPLLKNRALNHSWKTQQGHVAMEVVSQHMEKLECYACHSTWAPQCYGCHIKYDARKMGTDWPGSAMNHDPFGKQRIVQAPGDIAIENVGFMRWESPILAVNFKGRVAPAIPGCETVWNFVDSNGVLTASNKVYTTSTGHPSPTLAPLQPHANTAAARTCESCHTDPKAIGYGVGKSRWSVAMEGPGAHFGAQGTGALGDIPWSKAAKPQIPAMPAFPYAWDQLVTRDGKQVQNMPLLADRPLNAAERNLVEREGLCVACHQFYNTPKWERVRNKLRSSLKVDGRALTPEEHDKAVVGALDALAGP